MFHVKHSDGITKPLRTAEDRDPSVDGSKRELGPGAVPARACRSRGLRHKEQSTWLEVMTCCSSGLLRRSETARGHHLEVSRPLAGGVMGIGVSAHDPHPW